jgi:chromosome segregation ATPase
VFEDSLLKRRKLLSLSVLPVSLAATAGVAAARSQQLTFAAPGDITVQKFFVTYGKVKAGTTLATLSSLQLDRYKAMLDAHTQLVAIEERPFLDGRVDKQLQLTQAEAADAQAALTAAQAQVVKIQEEITLGNSAAQLQIMPATVELEDRTSELATINNELAELPMSIKDAKDRLAIAKQQIATQETALDALAALLTIVAPTSGLFIASVATGSFVKRGSEIGVLYP